MTFPSKLPASVLSLVCGLTVLACLCTGCIKLPFVGGDTPAAPLATPAASPLDEARTALTRSDFVKAESLAMRLTSAGLSAADTTEAARILAVAAMRNSHPSVAVSALDTWRQSTPNADAGREWQDLWCNALGRLSALDARTRANAVYQDTARTPLMRGIAAVLLAVRQWDDGELGQSLTALEGIYATARSSGEKAALEGRLAMQLHKATPAGVNLVASAPTAQNQGTFPYSIILIDKLRRQTLAPETRPAAAAALDALAGQIALADPALFKGPPAEVAPTFQQPVTSGPVSGRPVVLALPLSGQYGSISGKIAAGAQVACDEFSASGRAVTLVIIDTDKPDWISRLEALPQGAAVVGGPLRRSDYMLAKSRGITGRKALFAFLPSLEPTDEGRTAWRFFSSARDQIDALLEFTGRLGIKGYGVFYPDDNFGQRMTTLFEERVSATGGRVAKTLYAPGDPNSWLRSAGELLSGNKAGTAFRAVFLPDTWKNMDVIVPNIFYYQETRQVLLGTSLWEQGLAPGTSVAPQYYGLAVFPGSWNNSQPEAARLQSALLAAGKEPADFWTGLGYDFARMSANLGIGEGWTPGAVNSALQSVSLSWSIAPIRWRPDGTASQQMYLFSPAQNGFAPLNEQQFRKDFEAAWR